MSQATMYESFGPGKFGIPSGGPATATVSEIHALAGPSAADPGGSLLHPHNPLMAFGIIAAVAFGLMAFSTSVRVGKTSATLHIGDTK